MAWVERVELAGGECRVRVAERGPDGRTVKGERLRSKRDAHRLAGRTGLEHALTETEVARVRRGVGHSERVRSCRAPHICAGDTNPM